MGKLSKVANMHLIDVLVIGTVEEGEEEAEEEDEEEEKVDSRVVAETTGVNEDHPKRKREVIKNLSKIQSTINQNQKRNLGDQVITEEEEGVVGVVEVEDFTGVDQDLEVKDLVMSIHLKMKVAMMKLETAQKVKEKTDLHEVEPLPDVREDLEDDLGDHLHRVQATKVIVSENIAIPSVTMVII
jgi:hypothetical protein